ncbi:MAG: GtrA family protein [Nitrososphaerales archaeon]|jgi:putative flippase GtrA
MKRNIQKIGLYVIVSGISTVLSQTGLAASFGVWKWPIVPSIFFSLAVSVGPAFILSDLIIWRRSGNRGQIHRRAISFLLISAVGSGIAAIVVWLSVRIADLFSLSHFQLTVVANGASIGSSLLIWIGRYFILDRVVFRVPVEAGIIGVDHSAELE